MSIDRAAELISRARRGVTFTGAGISTESGIPDFRTPGTGIWSRYNPNEFTFERYVSDPEHRRRRWQMATQGGLRGHMVAVEPNAGHRALARLEELGLFRGVITQNIDGLHFAAGSRDVLELHGTSKRVACLSCKASWPSEEIIQRVRAGEDDPSCTECGGILKSATISFGQQLDPDVINEAERWAIESDVCLVVGSTLVVYPAAMIPEAAKASGAALVIVNREPTPLDGIADEVVLGEAGPTLTDLVGRVERLIS